MKKKFFALFFMCLLLASAVFLLRNVDTLAFGEKSTVTRIESFSSKVYEKGEKQDQEKGYKNVNSVTEMKETKKSIVTKVSYIEDYYDVNGNYINTIVKVEEDHKNLTSGNSTVKVREDEFQEPLALFTYRNTVTILNDEEKEQIKKQVTDYVKKLPK